MSDTKQVHRKLTVTVIHTKIPQVCLYFLQVKGQTNNL